MRIAICDDEVSMVQILEEKIKKLLPDAVIDKYLSGDELIASGSKPDILFLDIQMPGMDGMETAKVLRQDNEDMILIFVTAAEAYVFQAFDVGAFHYLVKPFSDEKFKEVVTKAVHNIKRSSRLEKDEKYIMVQTAGSHIKIFLRDIVYAEVYNRKVIIHTQNIGENQENTAKSKEKGVIQNSAYQAFLSAIQSDNQKLSQQYLGDWKDLRLNLNVSDGNRKMLNGIWDYYANKR